MNPIAPIIETLLDDNAVAAIVDTRIRPHPAEQGLESPYISIQQIGSSPYNLLAGTPVPNRDELVTVQVNCWSRSYREAKQLADAVDLAIAGVTDATTEPLIGSILKQNENDLPEFPTDGSAEIHHRVAIDYTVHISKHPSS